MILSDTILYEMTQYCIISKLLYLLLYDFVLYYLKPYMIWLSIVINHTISYKIYDIISYDTSYVIILYDLYYKFIHYHIE